MPTKPKPKPKPVNRRKNPTKRKQKSWMWWTAFLVPIALSIWMFAEPVFNEAKMVLTPSTSVEEIRKPSRSMSAPARSRTNPQPAETESKPIVTETVKDDVDWVLGHMYKLFPLILSLIALLKRDKMLGRKS